MKAEGHGVGLRAVNLLSQRERGEPVMSQYSDLVAEVAIESLASSRFDCYSLASVFEPLVPPLACSYANTTEHANLLAIADELGCVHITDTSYQFSSSNYRALLTWEAHSNAVFDVKWINSDRYILTASGDRTIKLWDAEQTVSIATCSGHYGSVKAVSADPEQPSVLVSASRDGTIRLWDLRALATSEVALLGATPFAPCSTVDFAHVPTSLLPKSYVSLLAAKKRKRGVFVSQQPAQPPSTRPDLSKFGVTSVLFVPHKSNQLLSTGSVDGALKLWDLRVSTKFASTTGNAAGADCDGTIDSSKKQHGFTWASVDSFGQYVYASCTDHSVYAFCLRDLTRPKRAFRHPQFRCDSFYIKLAVSPDDQYFVTSSSLSPESRYSEHGNAFVWPSVTNSTRNQSPVILDTLCAETVSVDWNRHLYFNEYELSVGCDASLIKTWRTDPCNFSSVESNLRGLSL